VSHSVTSAASGRALEKITRDHTDITRVCNLVLPGACSASSSSARCRAEATHQPVLRQRDQNRVGDVETNRAQLNDDAAVDERNPLDAMRLRVVEPNNITSP
jgi:hypothetical protein